MRLTGVGWKHSWCYERGHDSRHCWWGISWTLPQSSLRLYARLSRARVHPWLGWVSIGRVWVVSVLLLAIWLQPGLFITWREIWLWHCNGPGNPGHIWTNCFISIMSDFLSCLEFTFTETCIKKCYFCTPRQYTYVIHPCHRKQITCRTDRNV